MEFCESQRGAETIASRRGQLDKAHIAVEHRNDVQFWIMMFKLFLMRRFVSRTMRRNDNGKTS